MKFWVHWAVDVWEIWDDAKWVAKWVVNIKLFYLVESESEEKLVELLASKDFLIKMKVLGYDVPPDSPDDV